MQVASVKYNYISFTAAMVWENWPVRLKISNKLTSAWVSERPFPSSALPPFLPRIPLSFPLLLKAKANVNLTKVAQWRLQPHSRVKVNISEIRFVRWSPRQSWLTTGVSWDF